MFDWLKKRFARKKPEPRPAAPLPHWEWKVGGTWAKDRGHEWVRTDVWGAQRGRCVRCGQALPRSYERERHVPPHGAV